MWLVFSLISNAFWSIADVTNSVLVKHYERSPIALTWLQSIIDLLTLGVLATVFVVQWQWLGWFFVAGITSYLAFLVYFVVVDRLDVSVMNAAWVFMTIGIATGGFVLFGESWNMWQGFGVVLALGGVLLLSFWHQHISLGRTLGMLALLGFLYAPHFVIQKAAMLNGVSVFTAFYWPVFFQKMIAFSFPLIHPGYRNQVFSGHISSNPWFLPLNVFGVFASIAGWYTMTMAYNLGPASIVGVAENAQPYTTILLAWLTCVLVPKFAPRELISKQSIGIKILSFSLVFIGLGILAVF